MNKKKWIILGVAALAVFLVVRWIYMGGYDSGIARAVRATT